MSSEHVDNKYFNRDQELEDAKLEGFQLGIDARENQVAELDRLRKINSELVQSYNKLLLQNSQNAAELKQTQDALGDLYDYLPRVSCKSDEPDGCPVCVARSILRSI